MLCLRSSILLRTPPCPTLSTIGVLPPPVPYLAETVFPSLCGPVTLESLGCDSKYRGGLSVFLGFANRVHQIIPAIVSERVARIARFRITPISRRSDCLAVVDNRPIHAIIV